ncbi:uncharacterized protein [Macrobrachium rosenbergii]|uniref:uncharacterized protein n=1 Tax=Macrobrachium rosenbergii TaxID=79674 RepID=UPI0034D4F18C
MVKTLPAVLVRTTFVLSQAEYTHFALQEGLVATVYVKLKEKEIKQKQLTENEVALRNAKATWASCQNVGRELRMNIDGELEEIMNQHQHSTKTRILKKLANLNNGPLLIPQPVNGYINLTDIGLSPNQKRLLNFGLNCQVQRRVNPHHKRMEIEKLIEDIQELEKGRKINISPNLIPELICESGRNRGSAKSKILSKELITAAQELRENKDIVIRKADKTAVYVIMDKTDYLQKINEILSDSNKFRKISRDTTNAIKVRVNKVIDTINAKMGGVHFQKITGEYSPGYMYGNVKTHKNGNPLRPIISQIPTPTYALAKKLNKLLTPYVPTEFSLRSSKEFIDLLQHKSSQGLIASLDVESLFTNVPVEETIDMIIDEVYHGEKTPLDVPENLLRQLLRLCTKETILEHLMGDFISKSTALLWDHL